MDLLRRVLQTARVCPPQVCVPFCLTGLLLCWCILLLVFNPRDAKAIPQIPYKAAFTRRHAFVVAASALTVVGWATFAFTAPALGDLGIVALLFLGVMFGTGTLTQSDFNSFPWHLLFLLGGGHVLGDAIEKSGLLAQTADGLMVVLPQHDMFSLSLLLTLFLGVATTFVSHTVAALVMMPLIMQVRPSVRVRRDT